jgi:hypothetical protein
MFEEDAPYVFSHGNDYASLALEFHESDYPSQN